MLDYVIGLVNDNWMLNFVTILIVKNISSGWLREAVDDPDDVFKRVILFPLLECEIQHKVVILMVDGLDLDSIPPGAAASGEPSKSIPELLSRHAHLFPRWLLPVFTTRQSTAVTTHFPGFRRISIDDLRKTQVGLNATCNFL